MYRCPLPRRATIDVLLAIVCLFFIPVGIGAQEFILVSQEIKDSSKDIKESEGGFFPEIYFTDSKEAFWAEEDSAPYWVRTEAEQEAFYRRVTDYASVLLNSDILAFYGHPRSQKMGILGRYSMEELHQKLMALAEEYKTAGGRDVKLAFYIIYGTAWPEGKIGIINQDILKQWVEFALKNDMLVFIDHQIGNSDPVASIRQMLPWLHYPNVHLAFDPEWRTNAPMQEIGYLNAEEINRAQQVMEEYIIDNNLPGERLLVVHQFHWSMIRNRGDIKATFRRVRLVHSISGIGTPKQKRETYDHHGGRTPNVPVKAFKLWFNFNIPNVGYDNPLMTPKEVYTLKPRPYIIIYQ